MIEQNQELQKRFIESQVTTKEKELHIVKLNTALELFSQQRTHVEVLLERYMVNPLLHPTSRSVVQKSQGELSSLKVKTKVEELHRTTLSIAFMSQEEKYKKEIED